MQDAADRLAWWREARFGMFIHWGLYAVPGGQWQGKAMPGLGEWIMRHARIPIPEYERLAGQFNPVEFNAREWVGIAKRAGMTYIVITAKHHDGFAMYRSPCCRFNIADATPFGRDPMAELAEACRAEGLRLCFYYSQAQDWHAPGGAGHWESVGDQELWRTGGVAPADFARYLEEKAVPQVRELLTQYGPIGLIWFDTPVAITREQSLHLRELVHSLQPDCLVSGRVGHDVGDYGSLGDNQIPCGPVRGDWETPATINDTWGFRSDDHHWKSVRDLLYLLVDLASKGVNYLLNVGPTARGTIPTASVERLEAIGRWLAVNGAAIYGTQQNPYPYEFEWGRVTRRGDRLYLLLFGWPAELRLCGLRNRVLGARLLAAPDRAVGVDQRHDAGHDRHVLVLRLPGVAPDPNVSVVELQLDGEVAVDPSIQPQPSGSLVLPAYLAEITGPAGVRPVTIDRRSVAANWKDTGHRACWRGVGVDRAGEYEVRVVLASVGHGRPVCAGHRARVTVAGQTLAGPLTCNEPVQSPRAAYHPEAATCLGRVRLESGRCQAEVAAEAIRPEAGEGFALVALQLTPV